MPFCLMFPTAYAGYKCVARPLVLTKLPNENNVLHIGQNYAFGRDFKPPHAHKEQRTKYRDLNLYYQTTTK